jgi:hypothetical protein
MLLKIIYMLACRVRGRGRPGVRWRPGEER